MGTPDFAVPPLETLNENFEVSLVVSQKDKLRNRKKLLPTPVTCLKTGAGNETRTRNPQLGRLMLYH